MRSFKVAQYPAAVLIAIAVSACAPSPDDEAPAAPSTTEQPAADALTPSSDSLPLSSIPEDVTYTIIGEDIVPDIRRSLDVRLNRRVSGEVLNSIAMELTSDQSEYERTFILYYLPDMEVGAGAWASTHFNPDLEVRILGLTAEEEQALAQPSNDPSREVIGTWLDDGSFGSRITIFREGEGLFMENVYGDGSSGTTELTETSSPSGRRFDYEPDRGNGEYFLINSSGDLEEWDPGGRFLTAGAIDADH